MPAFFDRLKERKIVQWGLAYLAGAFVVFQLVEVAAEPWGLSTRFQQTVHVLLVLGLPIVAVGAWYHGEQGRQRVSGPELVMVTALLVIAGAAVYIVGGSSGEAVGPTGLPVSARGVPGGTPSIAVLPCDNMSPDAGDESFASGIHEEILLRLQRIGALKTISRTSVLQYRDNPPPVPEIAAALGVGYVGECSVRRDEGRIRLTFQLIDGVTEGHLWADSYDQELSAGTLLDIQSDIAQQIAQALRAELSPAELTQLEERPTQNLEAYDFYLRGNARFNWGYVESDIRYAIQMYEQAVALDPSFLAAFARLSRAHGDMYWFSHDRTPTRAEAARTALDRALELDPDHPETLNASGFYHYHILLDYAAALREFSRGLARSPNDPLVLTGMGYVHRRMGDLELAAELIARALELDPQSSRFSHNLGETQFLLGRYAEAERSLEQSRDVRPSWGRTAGLLGFLELARSGDPVAARRRIDEGIRAGAVLADDSYFALSLLTTDFFANDPEAVVRRLQFENWGVIESQFFYLPSELIRGEALALLGDDGAARGEFESALDLLERQLRESPEDERIHSALGLVYAGLGLPELAMEHGERGVALMPYSKEAYKGSFRQEDLARIYAAVGERDEAVDAFRTLLTNPSLVSPTFLRADPRLGELREDPAFLSMLEEFG